ncbi:O-methyltransferase [Arsenicibacter rosenii]|uniref:SAM-dependent methyltransferase n=1 Tax=Arsenicibacter rosenii TaxID=1750698 RepID=A0A1S2VIK2_9BACT|nr:class I SAM-dependent methyltransferase [Arsenicibacter rosenii]OIN58572.1 SAM-dependent methyltransferase [Arsenicibacter rosenii]
MNETDIRDVPAIIAAIDAQSQAIGFNQKSDDLSGALLQVLAACKPGGRFLELGTGAGRATAWLLQGMSADADLISVEFDAGLIGIARTLLGHDSRLTLLEERGEAVLTRLEPSAFDMVFADTWPGKYNHLEEALQLVKTGGFYVIDDMLPQPNWPEGHAQKVQNLIETLENDLRFKRLKMNWASGVIILVRVA